MSQKLTEKELKEFSEGIEKIVKANPKWLDDYKKNKHNIDADWSEKSGIRRR